MSSNQSTESSAVRPRRSKFKTGLKILIVLYLFILLVVLTVIKTVGERNWICSLLLYLPPTGWLLPLLVFFPLSLFLERHWRWVQISAVLGVMFYYMDFLWAFSSRASTTTLKILTNNIGQRKTRTLSPFLEKEKPDIVAFQEAWAQSRVLSRQHPDRFVAGRGEFVLVSKFEIKNSGFVPGFYSAAWFEINYHGQSVVIYNVHLPTPRNDFSQLRGKGFLTELARRGGIYAKEKREAYKQSMSRRVSMANALMEQLRKETRPFLVVGDFNAPSQGHVYDIFSSNLTDAFGAKGCGYGLTFPGSTWNPLSLFGPWLRIDYIFADKEWKPLSCRREPRQDAQHLAVVAELELKSSK